MLEEITKEGDILEEGHAGISLLPGLGDQPAKDDRGTAGHSDGRGEGLGTDGGNGCAGNNLRTGDGIVLLGDLEGDLLIGIDEGDDFQFEDDILVIDI